MNDTAYFNQSTLSDESKDGWPEESKKINDAILWYEKMNDMAYFNQSTLSDESKKMAGPKKLKLKVALTQIRGSKTTPIKGSKMARFVHGIQGSGSGKKDRADF